MTLFAAIVILLLSIAIPAGVFVLFAVLTWRKGEHFDATSLEQFAQTIKRSVERDDKNA